MSLDQEPDGTNGTNPENTRSDKPRVATKVVGWLSDRICQKHEAATDRPGARKSMLAEAALARFLDPAQPTEGHVQEALERNTGQHERLDGDVRIIAETVALHARYHLTVAPSIPPPRPHKARTRGKERFGQVDRRVQLGRPLAREAIEKVNASKADGSEPVAASPAAAIHDHGSRADTTADPTAAAEEDGSDRTFPHPPDAVS